MVPDVVNLGLVAAYLFVLTLLAVRYRRGGIDRPRALLLAGASLTWLAYGLLQITQDGVLPTGTTLNNALDGLAIAVLVVGLYAMYRWWRERDDGTDDVAVDTDRSGSV